MNVAATPTSKHLVTRLLPAGWRWRHLVICLLAVLIAVPAMARAKSAAADGPPSIDVPTLDPSRTCVLTKEGVCVPPPPLLSVEALARGALRATPEQTESLRRLEQEAIDQVIELHGLPESDRNAVQSWGRDEALGTMFTLLMEAVRTDAADRTQDQENAVAWLTAATQRRALRAAEAAGREYVKWAGLDDIEYMSLVDRNPTQGQLEEFLNDPPQNWVPPHLTTGYCVYRSPAPYGSEYTGYHHPTCFAPCPGFFCFPPTPSYDQFVKWGESAASYSMLNQWEFARTAGQIGSAVGLGIAVAAAITAGALVPAMILGGGGIWVGATAAATALTGLVANFVVPYSGILSVGAIAAFIAAVVIVAVTIAVVQGIAVISASQLPGQLAELITDARTNAPDVASLANTEKGATTLFSIFVGAALPAPATGDLTCHNSGVIRGELVIDPNVQIIGMPPCLNPTGIPEPVWSDPQFLIEEHGTAGGQASPTITWKDGTTGAATTGRLHDNWFITTTDGTTEQRLELDYTGWDGKHRKAYLLGDPTHGYAFVSLDVSSDTDLDVANCLGDGTCSESASLQYLSPDGKKLSATVQPWRPATGEPSFDATPDEGETVAYDANGFAPANATGAISYQWRFESSPCYRPCVLLDTMDGPVYGDPVAGETVTHTWPHGGTFSVELTATDSTGRKASTRVDVNVNNEQPILELAPDCVTNADGDPVSDPGCLPRAGGTATARRLSGVFGDVSVFDLTVFVNWGDGSDVVSDCAEVVPGHFIPFGEAPCEDAPGNGLDVQRASDDQFSFDASHTYAEPGTYFGTIWVSDGVLGTSHTFTMTIAPDVLVTTNTADGVVRTAEQDATAQPIEVRLAEAPTEEVTVTFGSGGGQTVPASATFTPDNWNEPQTVIIRPVDDHVDETDPHSTSVAVSVDGGATDVRIDGTPSPVTSNIPVEIADNDEAGLLVSPDPLVLSEGSPATLTVGLASEPQQSGVRVGTQAVGSCTVTPATLFFEDDRDSRSLTVTPISNDSLRPTNCTVWMVVLAGSSPEYKGVRADNTWPVTNTDIPGVTVTPTDLILDSSAANPTATYRVVLDTRPESIVIVTPTVATDSAVTTSGAVVFSNLNWNQPKTVTVTAATGGSAPTATIGHTVTPVQPNPDSSYLDITVPDVHVTFGNPATTMSLAAEPDPASNTEATTVSATVRGEGIPSGTVRFTVDGVATGGEVAVIDEVAHLDVGLLSVGTHTVTATYSSTSNHHPSTATVDFIVTAIPEPGDDTLTVAEDAEATTIDVSANDTDADGDTLTIETHTPPANGHVTCGPTSCTYTPNPDFHGTDGFTYTVTDGTHTATATVTITVTSVNDAPVASADAYTTAEDIVLSIAGGGGVLANDTDTDGDGLTIDTHTQPAHGEATCGPMSCTYTPAPEFHGTDSFTYTVTDGTATATATATITVSPANDAPAAGDDTLTVDEDPAAAALEVLANDSDVDGDTLTIEEHSQPAHGEATCGPTSCTYTPDPEFHGIDSFTYTVTDGTATATATVTITVSSVNDAPVASADALTIDEDADAATIDVSANDTDVDGDTLTIDTHTQPAHGEATCGPTSCTYTPEPELHGTDSFTYTVTDGTATATATVTITVSPVNDAPVASADAYTTSEDTAAAALEVLSNDSDVDGDTLAIDTHTQPAHGEATCGPTSCTYTPEPEFHGTDSFTYTVTDGTATATATATIAVSSVNDSPVAAAEAYTTAVDTALDVTAADGVLANDSDVEGDTLVAVVVGSGSAHGTVTMNEDGSFSYLPATGYNGPDSFTYRVRDNHGAMSKPATASLRVEIPTATALAATPNPSRLSQAVSFTATVTSGGVGVSAGTVTFRDRTTTLAADVPVDGQGRATFTTSTLADGTHPITATYSGEPGWEASTSRSLTHTVDSNAPTITIRAPTTRRYLQHAVAFANYACSDQTSGVATCTGPVTDGSQIDTSTPGIHRFTVTARDRAGNQRTATVTYRVLVPPTCAGLRATIVGTAGTDVITGTPDADVIVSGGRRDLINGRGGNDTICTGAGADTVRAGTGDDTVNAGADRDIVIGGTGNDTISGHTGNDTLLGVGGNDQLYGGGNTDRCLGGAGTDRATACEQLIAIP